MNIQDIKVYNKNAKIHTEEQLNKIADSIKKFGFDQAVVIDKKGVIIIGHGRFLAAKNILKWTEIKVGVSFAKKGDRFIPIVKREDLSDLEVKVRRINDNKLNESAWDMSLLTTELKEIAQSEEYQDLSIDIENTNDISLTGFDKKFSLENILDIGWNPGKTEEAELGDGINEKVGYGLQSFWKDLNRENSELGDYWIELPVQGKTNLVRQKYSRTNLEEIRRVIKTYMREGDYFLESCCGWSTFSCSAALCGFSGVGGDIWETAISHGKKQYDVIKDIKGVGKYKVIKADAMNLPFKDNEFDFVYCNPPFMDEEKYSGLDNDIATKNEIEFKNKFVKLMQENYRVLKPNNLCVITINDKREKGFLEPLHSKVIEYGVIAGFKLWDFVVAEVFSQKIRLRKKDYALKRTVKCHEYVIVFKKV